MSSPDFTEKKIAELKLAFSKFDKNGDGMCGCEAPSSCEPREITLVGLAFAHLVSHITVLSSYLTPPFHVCR